MKTFAVKIFMYCSLCLFTVSCQIPISASNNNNNTNKNPINQLALFFIPFNFDKITVDSSVLGSIKSSSAVSEDTLVHIATANNSVVASNCIILKNKSSCNFKITAREVGISSLYASAIGYKGDQSQEINVVDTNQLAITADSSVIIGNNINGIVSINNNNTNKNPVIVTINSNNNKLIVDSQCVIQPGEYQCSFQLKTISPGTTEITAMAHNYKSSLLKTICVINKTQLILKIKNNSLNLKDIIQGSVTIAENTHSDLNVTIISSESSVINNTSCIILAESNSCDFNLTAFSVGSTQISASTVANTDYTNSASIEIKVLDKLQLYIAEFETHSIGLNACLPINIKSVVGVEQDIEVKIMDTNGIIPDYYSSTCIIKKGFDTCNTNLCAKDKTGAIKISVIAAPYKVILPSDVSLQVAYEQKIIAPDNLNNTIMDVGQTKTIAIKIPHIAQTDLKIGITNYGTGILNNTSCIIKQGQDGCDFNLTAAYNSGSSTIELVANKIYSSVILGQFTVNNSLILEIPNPQFKLNQENTITIKLPQGSPAVTADSLFYLTIIGSDMGLSNYQCMMKSSNHECTIITKAQKQVDNVRLEATESVSYPNTSKYSSSNQVQVSVT
jgi:hypothetical protein